MAKTERYHELAEHIVDAVGGKENISYFSRCVTRLRFVVKDKSLVEPEKVDALPGVLASQWSGEQFQVIIGQAVEDAYNLIVKMHDLERQEAVAEPEQATKKRFSLSTVFDAIAGSITPLIPVLIGAGFVKIVLLLLTQFNVLAADSPTGTVLTFVGDAGFYFLPIYIGGVAAKKFGANFALGMLMGGILVHPSFSAAVSEGTALNIFGLPIFGATYSSSVIPIILICAVMAPVERFFARISPDSVRSIVEPFATLVVMVPLALCVLAPLGSYLGTYLSQAIIFLYSTTGAFGVAIFGALWPWLVMTGMHHALTPYALDALAQGAEYVVFTGSIISNINQGVAAVVVGLKNKDANLRSTAFSCAVTAIIGGVTEPGMFGINLRFKTPMYGAMIGTFAGALVAGFGRAAAHAMTGSTGLLGGLPVYLGGDISNLLWMVAGIVVGAIVAAIATFVLYKPEATEQAA
ncbi:PTS transporter subunit EIIC [Collinsella sp. zg1085]|uniref:PTS transporter subunit EIIC n=1 Tax=Collinsella sp. zg1085 TaxID=2844380 RepID=UPI001C0C204F|nr:PTS transporter subunit EIIC [Collinsella sp. zg1085]QWT18218.1 PTS transporter subunit EIIC [Collinsella sp. zg1085]